MGEAVKTHRLNISAVHSNAIIEVSNVGKLAIRGCRSHFVAFLIILNHMEEARKKLGTHH
jgi:hypothetical protein